MKYITTAGIVLGVLTTWTGVVSARSLSFEERVAAQEAIERVHYSHQVGATKTFEVAVSREALEGKVRRYLAQSVALERLWATPVTTRMLQRELERQAGGTRMPDRLRELYRALGNDPFLIAECLARPALADRLTRNFFAVDDRVHGSTKRTAERLREDLVRNGLDEHDQDRRRHEVDLIATDSPTEVEVDRPRRFGTLPVVQLSREEFARKRERLPASIGEVGSVREEPDAFVIEVVTKDLPGLARVVSFVTSKTSWDTWWESVFSTFDEGRVVEVSDELISLPEILATPSDTWDNGSLDDSPDPRAHHTAVWTGAGMLVWGGDYSNTGSKYDPATDSWSPVTTSNAPAGHVGHSAVWTGKEMIVWGGGDLDTGGRYDPTTDQWLPMSTVGAPSGRTDHEAVWTGQVMLVWGGHGPSGVLDSGGRYDPQTDAWLPISANRAPSPRYWHTAVWSGREMIVWGGGRGFPTSETRSGGKYDPVRDRWSTMEVVGAPFQRVLHTAVWTGSEMIVWGGFGKRFLGTGGRYDPVANRWSPLSTLGAPAERYDHVAVWTGDRMVVWGGNTVPSGLPENTGGRYDPTNDSWVSTSTLSAPPGAHAASAVWTGDSFIVWGGSDAFYPLDSGGRYHLATDTWTPTTNRGGPSARISHSAVWTGSHMIVWGGEDSSAVLDTGARYDPATDTWMPTATIGVPKKRLAHSATWTGNSMIVWGGADRVPHVEYLDTGATYDPIVDQWSRISLRNAPTARAAHTAVWTGTEIIVWGGNYSGGYLNSGAKYNPVSNTWLAVSESGLSARDAHTGIWTGERMIIWGGFKFDGSFHYFDTGGVYDPETDSWTMTSLVNVPVARTGHAWVWTGNRLVVCGGFGASGLMDTGGRYDPVSDVWEATSTLNAPTPRVVRATWTGSVMVVWGGNTIDGETNTGGRYDPSGDTWLETSMENAPSARERHVMVWTGERVMIWGGRYDGFLSSGGSYSP